MSAPRIPGFTAGPVSLLGAWRMPQGNFDSLLWPSELLKTIEPFPSEWLIVERYENAPKAGWTGVSTFLTTEAGWLEASKTQSWSARYLGEYLFDDRGQDENGLTETLGSSSAEFLVGVQRNHGLHPLSVDLSLSFQWFWSAMRNGNNWSYLDVAGNEHPLVRTVVNGKSYQVEIRALELRRYLERRQLVAVVQYDHVTYADSEPFEASSEYFTNEWASFIWTPSHQRVGPAGDSFSRLLGKCLVVGVGNGPSPMSLDWDNPAGKDFPEFIYGIDSRTGETMSFSSNPDALANYFGANPDAPHYLTPVYFDPKVLNKYRDEPTKYSLSTTRLDCLGLWGLSLGESTTGLVEAYLGDLGRDLPWQEWLHWKAHNVPPSGEMSEDRFRRDFLAQWAGEPSTLEAMRESLVMLREASERALGWPLIRELTGAELVELNALRLPTTSERRELLIPVLTLAKAFVDAIDERRLRKHLELDGTEGRSLALLERLVSDLGGDLEVIQPFRTLYKLRSSGGVAHWGGGEVDKTIEKLGLNGMTPAEVVSFLATGLRQGCDAIRQLLEKDESL